MASSSWWKEFYSIERASLGKSALDQLIENAPSMEVPSRGAIVFPHTRLAASGYFTAAAAHAVIASGCDTVVALGVLHGIPHDRNDVHGIHFNDATTRNEFSLDNFAALLKRSSNLLGRAMPNYIPAFALWRKPGILEPEEMPGFAEVAALVEDGAMLVATADMVHHGRGYGTPRESCLEIVSDAAIDYSRQAIGNQLSCLAIRNYNEFRSQCERARSDFRDVGPVLAALLPLKIHASLFDLTLVNYADVLPSEEPTWVAAALATLGPAEAGPAPL